MAADTDDGTSSLEEFLSGSALDPDALGEPPLSDGNDHLLTRERVYLDSDEK